MTVVLNGLKAMHPDELVVNEPPVQDRLNLNGLPGKLTINGLDREQVPSGCQLNLPLYHPALNGSTFKSLDINETTCTNYGTLWTPQGRWFDGSDDKINLGNWASIEEPTVEVWLKSAGAGYVFTHLSRWQVADIDWALFTSELAVYRFTGLTTLTFPSIADGHWHYLAFTISGTTCKVYRDGVLKDSDTVDAYVSKTKPMWLGTRELTAFYGGIIGKVRVHNRAFAADEIERNFYTSRWRFQ